MLQPSRSQHGLGKMPIADGLPHSDFHPEACEFRQEAAKNFPPSPSSGPVRRSPGRCYHSFFPLSTSGNDQNIWHQELIYHSKTIIHWSWEVQKDIFGCPFCLARARALLLQLQSIALVTRKMVGNTVFFIFRRTPVAPKLQWHTKSEKQFRNYSIHPLHLQ